MTDASTPTGPDSGKTDPLVALIGRIREGDEDAARQLFDRYRDSVMGYCLLATDGDRDRAKDLTQESFIRAFEKIDQLRDPENFTSWFWTIVRRRCADYGDRRSRQAEILDLFAINRDVVFADDDKAARERRIQVVQELLDEIDDEDLAAIVEMKYTEPEHTTREIARELEMPHGTVTVKLMRFRESIEDELTERLEAIDPSLSATGAVP